MSEYNSKSNHEQHRDSKLDHRNDVKSAPESKQFTMPTASEPIQLPKLSPQDHQQTPFHQQHELQNEQTRTEPQQSPYFNYYPQPPVDTAYQNLYSVENDVSGFFNKWWFYILKIIVLIVAIFIGLTIIPNDVMSMSKKFGVGLLSVVIYIIIDIIFNFLGNHKGDMCKVTCGC